MWARARHRWVTQLLVRLGLEPDLLDFLNKDGTVLSCFDKGKIVPLRLDGIVWWDKVHMECFIGDYRQGSKTQTKIPRNPDRTYNPDSEYKFNLLFRRLHLFASKIRLFTSSRQITLWRN